MARSRRAAAPAPKKCTCNPGVLVIAWILMALGLWALVGGFATQFGSSAPTAVNVSVLGWYFAGILLVSLAKVAKWKGCGSCIPHKM